LNFFLLPDDKRTVMCGKYSTQLRQINATHSGLELVFLGTAHCDRGIRAFIYLLSLLPVVVTLPSEMSGHGIFGSTWDGVVWVSRNMEKGQLRQFGWRSLLVFLVLFHS